MARSEKPITVLSDEANEFNSIQEKDLAFLLEMLSADESVQLRPRIIGPVLCFDPQCAIDRDANAILLDLGGKPSLDPALDEPPGHYNMLWNEQTIAAAGNFKHFQRNGSYVRQYSLDVTIPHALASKVDHIKQLFQAGMSALYWNTTSAFKTVEVVFDHVSYV